MNNLINQIRRFIGRARGLFPSPIPTGMTEFTHWVDSIVDLYTLPTSSRDDVVFALASMIMHSGPTTSYKSKHYFVVCLKAGAAKQIAGANFYDLKTKQETAAKAAMLAAQAAANATQV